MLTNSPSQSHDERCPLNPCRKDTIGIRVLKRFYGRDALAILARYGLIEFPKYGPCRILGTLPTRSGYEYLRTGKAGVAMRQVIDPKTTCPFCLSRELRAIWVQKDGTTFYSHHSCDKCDSTWNGEHPLSSDISAEPCPQCGLHFHQDRPWWDGTRHCRNCGHQWPTEDKNKQDVKPQ